MALSKRAKRKRSAKCSLRSECSAKRNRRYFNRFLADDWDYLAIKRDPASGEYEMSKV